MTYTEQIHKMFQDNFKKRNKIIELSKDQYRVHPDEEEKITIREDVIFDRLPHIDYGVCS